MSRGTERILFALCVCGHLFYLVESKYLGCFASNHSTIFPVRFIRVDLTLQLCAELCIDQIQNYSLIGLQYGSYCYCGKEEEEYGDVKTVLDAYCNVTCYGEERCGGRQAIAIYENRTYKGCYSYHDVVHFSVGGKFANLTLNSCLAACSYFSFVGLTGGDQCYCSDESLFGSLNNSLHMLEDNLCMDDGIRCAGGTTCGGYGMVAVWNSITDIKTTQTSTNKSHESESHHTDYGKDQAVCKGITLDQRSVLYLCLAYVCGITSVCAAMLLFYKCRPHVLSRMIGNMKASHYELDSSYGPYMETHIDEKTCENPTQSTPVSLQRHINHSYHITSATDDERIPRPQIYSPIKDENSLWNTLPANSILSSSKFTRKSFRRTFRSFEDICSDSDRHYNAISPCGLVRSVSNKGELAYAVSNVALAKTHQNDEETSRSSQDSENVTYFDPDTYTINCTGKESKINPLQSSTFPNSQMVFQPKLTGLTSNPGPVKYCTLEKVVSLTQSIAEDDVSLSTPSGKDKVMDDNLRPKRHSSENVQDDSPVHNQPAGEDAFAAEAVIQPISVERIVSVKYSTLEKKTLDASVSQNNDTVYSTDSDYVGYHPDQDIDKENVNATDEVLRYVDRNNINGVSIESIVNRPTTNTPPPVKVKPNLTTKKGHLVEDAISSGFKQTTPDVLVSSSVEETSFNGAVSEQPDIYSMRHKELVEIDQDILEQKMSAGGNIGRQDYLTILDSNLHPKPPLPVKAKPQKADFTKHVAVGNEKDLKSAFTMSTPADVNHCRLKQAGSENPEASHSAKHHTENTDKLETSCETSSEVVSCEDHESFNNTSTNSNVPLKTPPPVKVKPTLRKN